MLVYAYAKINWTLNVLSRRPDGYHELDMLMQSVDLCDDIELVEADGLSLDISGPCAGQLSAGDDNLMLRAARLLADEAGVARGAKMRLYKRIPTMAGLGGGSSDAAAVLRALNAMWGAGLSDAGLCRLGARLGADIPYCLTGGLCRAEGLGERLTGIPGAPELDLIIAMPAPGLSTRDVFRTAEARPRQDMPRAIDELRAGHWGWLNTCTANDLQAGACAMRPEIRECIAMMQACGAAFARMTGSGSAVYGVFDRALIGPVYKKLRRVYPDSCVARTLP